MSTKFDNPLEENLVSDKGLSKDVIIERAERGVVEYMKQLLAKEYHCSESEALLYWDAYKKKQEAFSTLFKA